MTVASTFETQMLSLINLERAAAGLPALRLNSKLNTAAENHSLWMLEADIFSHTGENGSSASGRMSAAGYVFSGSWAAGENIAWQSERGTTGIADDVVNLHNALMNSPGHRANILSSSYAEIGIGIEVGQFTTSSGSTYLAVMATQNFARSAADNGGSGAPPGNPFIGNGQANHILGTLMAETLDGRGGNDKLEGRGGSDALLGGDGRDALFGGGGDDVLDGGAWGDRLTGGFGNDVLTGGFGADSFVFAKDNGVDRIVDFADNQDTLVFFGGLWDGRMSARAFVDAHASQVGDDVVFDFASGQQVVVIGIASIAQLYDDVQLIA